MEPVCHNHDFDPAPGTVRAMYAGFGFRSSEIGDVDVLWYDGLYHLFHLVLPNHDYIAHAVSSDGLTWQRVENALFISDPGGWDDDMLWTMHITTDPHRPGTWRMFYTGLCMRESGRLQRVGVARSTDLYHWEKDTSEAWPLQLPGEHYEHSLDEGRHWVSFRDPFYFRHDGRGYLLAAARVNQGPVIRRGCVALAEEVAPDRFEFRPPLYHPGRYDDVEVPGIFELDGRYYLIGSIREDIKVHYWYADELTGPYRNFSDNVLLPQGNYAARICRDPSCEVPLVWNFFYKGGNIRGDHLLPPPKEVEITERGALRLRSYRGFDAKVTATRRDADLLPLDALFGNPSAFCDEGAGRCGISSRSGLEAFLVQGEHCDYRLSGTLVVETSGKFGLVMHTDGEGDGYYISLDLAKGVAQIRYWATNSGGTFEEAFSYDQIQSADLVPRPGPVPFRLISFGDYIELSLYGYVVLSLADARFDAGRVGFYVESSELRVLDLALETLESPPRKPHGNQPPDWMG
jgi:beta-fructofuranosidase